LLKLANLTELSKIGQFTLKADRFQRVEIEPIQFKACLTYIGELMNNKKRLMKSTPGLVLALCLFIIAACNGGDKKGAVALPVSDLYLDYKVSAEESAEYAVALFYFRDGGANAKSIELEKGSQVSFDGEPLKADSAKLAGIYYEAQRPLAGFAGPHQIIYKDKQGHTIEQSFQYIPLILESIPAVLSRKDLVLKLGKSAGKGKIQVLVTDTSFRTTDINEEYTAENGQILIPGEALKKVANGPITLELVKEETKYLPNGKLTLSYTLRRELELR
jgi:hypothetical protein